MARAHVERPGTRGAGAVAASVLVALTIGAASRVVSAEVRPRIPEAPPPVAPPANFKPPVLLHFVEAPPPASLGGREEAEVVLTIDVDEAGHVKSVEVARSAGGAEGPALDAAAVAAARQFVFEPGQAEGHPVPVRITYSYKFVLKPAAPTPAPPPAPGAAPTGPTAPLAGVVRHRGDRAPVAGVTVSVSIGPGPADTREVATDGEGRFAFDALPVGTHPLALRGADIVSADTTITLHEGKRLELQTYVDVKQHYVSTVRGRRAVVEAVEHTLSVQEVQKIPGTQGDTLKAVQNLPGVARAPFGIGSLPVWGSAPQDTRVYVDGVFIPLLYHFGGLRSTFNSEMVQSLTFVPGAYQAEHGLGLGGLVDIDSRRPRTDGLHGYAQMDLVDGSAMLEGKLSRTLSFAVAGRRSWIDATLPHLTSNSLQLTPIYYDYQARVVWRPSPRDDLDVMLFGSDDRLKLLAAVKNDALSAAVGSHTYFHRGLVDWTHRFARGGTLSWVTFVGYDVPFGLGVQFGAVPSSLDQHAFAYGSRAVARLPLGDHLHLDGGLDFEGQRFTMDRVGSGAITTDPASAAGSATTGASAAFSGQVSGFFADHLTLYENAVAPFLTATISTLARRLTITPQLRLQIMTFAGYVGSPSSFSHAYVSPEPRLALRYALTARVALKAAVGLYSQPPDPGSFSQVYGNPSLPPQKATHYLVGADFEVTRTLHVEATGFYKDLRNLDVTPTTLGGPALVDEGVGRAFGGELLVRQELARNFFGWLSYTLSRSERKDHPGEPWHAFAFDQTNIFTAVASRILPRGFQVGGRFRYVTGTPLTPILGSFYDATSDRYTPIAGPTLGARLPSFVELDLRVDKTFTFDKWRFGGYLDLQNVTNSKNPEALSYNYNYTISHPVSGLPILPILGLRGDF
jgi:TonB family protein